LEFGEYLEGERWEYLEVLPPHTYIYIFIYIYKYLYIYLYIYIHT